MLSTRELPSDLEIPPTAVGGSFKCFLPENYPATWKSHQRQLVDRSNAFYPRTTQRPGNPTNGSWWIVQMLSTRELPSDLEIPPTAVGGSFKCFLPENYPATWKSHQRQLVDRSNAFYPRTTQRPGNPTNGSWWIVQMLSKRGFEISTHCRGWDYQTLQGYACRKDLNQSTHCRGWNLRLVQSVSSLFLQGF